MTDNPDNVAPGSQPSLLARLKARILPEMPDFYGLLVEQSAVTARGTERLAAFLKDNGAETGKQVRRLEHEGDRIKERNLAALHRSFATPMDREDFYDAVVAIDEILNYAKTTVREVEILGVSPDAHLGEMAQLVNAGAQSLLLGFQHLQTDPDAAERFAEQAHKAERSIEKAYRRALAELFDPAVQLERLKGLDSAGASPAALDRRSEDTLFIVTQMLKRREIYRHLSNAGDHVAHAAQILEDIVNKAS